MASQRRRARWTGKYHLVAGRLDCRRPVTCNVQCSSGQCDRRMVDVRLDTLPQDLPWSKIGWRLICTECGAAGSVHIAPNWHDRAGHAVPFTKHWKTCRRLLEHAHAFEPMQEGRIYIEKLNGPVRRQGSTCGIHRRPRARDFAQLAEIARERHLREAHAKRRRPVRLMAENGWQRGIEPGRRPMAQSFFVPDCAIMNECGIGFGNINGSPSSGGGLG
jgi:hypothetical protein